MDQFQRKLVQRQVLRRASPIPFPQFPESGLYNFRNRDYSPTLGRWMQMDPLGYAAGDANLYRVLGNNATNLTDPRGLSEEVVLGTVPGPASAYAKGAFTEYINVGPVDGMVSYIAREAKPIIEYRQVRGGGRFVEPGAQTWGQPGGGTAEGSGRMLQSGDYDLTETRTNAKYGGAQSIIVLTGTGDCCNTLIAGKGQSNDASELIASVHYFKCGTYKFRIKVEYKLVQDPGRVGGNVTTRIADEKGKLKEAQTGRTANRRGYRIAQDSRVYDLTIKIGKSGSATVAKIDPRLSGQTGRAKFVRQIWILDIDGPN